MQRCQNARGNAAHQTRSHHMYPLASQIDSHLGNRSEINASPFRLRSRTGKREMGRPNTEMGLRIADLPPSSPGHHVSCGDNSRRTPASTSNLKLARQISVWSAEEHTCFVPGNATRTKIRDESVKRFILRLATVSMFHHARRTPLPHPVFPLQPCVA